jgi:hypothetical protein
MEAHREVKEDICRRLRETVKEFGQKEVTGAIIIGNLDISSCVGGHKYLIAKTISNHTLANVKFKVARFFEDI